MLAPILGKGMNESEPAPAESQSPSRVLGRVTALVGLFIVLTGILAMLGALGLGDRSPARSDHFGLSSWAGTYALVLGIPCSILVSAIGVLYIRVSLRAVSVAELRDPGHASLCIAACTVFLMLSVDWKYSESVAWHVLAVASIVVLGSHGVLMAARCRPRDAAPPPWLLPVAGMLVGGAVLVARTAPDRGSSEMKRIKVPAASNVR